MVRKGWKKPKNVVLYTKNITDKGDNMLERVNHTKDLKKLTEEEKKKLAQDIRKYIIEVVSENGVHLASNLGVVELRVGVDSVFDVF